MYELSINDYHNESEGSLQRIMYLKKFIILNSVNSEYIKSVRNFHVMNENNKCKDKCFIKYIFNA